jgi:hypothetical protein
MEEMLSLGRNVTMDRLTMWKVVLSASILAVLGGAALASNGLGGGSEPSLLARALPGLVSGLISGVSVTAIAELWLRPSNAARDLTIKLTEQYLGRTAEEARVLGILQQDPPQSLSEVIARNEVRQIGNWFNLVAVLVDRRKLDDDLLDVTGVVRNAILFRRDVDTASNRRELGADAKKQLEDMLADWKGLASLERRFGSSIS